MAVTELEQIAHRIRARARLDLADRQRQRELIRERIEGGATWDEVMREAQVSRPTIMGALLTDAEREARRKREQRKRAAVKAKLAKLKD